MTDAEQRLARLESNQAQYAARQREQQSRHNALLWHVKKLERVIEALQKINAKQKARQYPMPTYTQAQIDDAMSELDQAKALAEAGADAAAVTKHIEAAQASLGDPIAPGSAEVVDGGADNAPEAA